ncbi:type I polyketide synthase [Actinophytocola algeriensis]|uniref:Acyl transferase domain-containing protein/acyl carrier protein n=1 Tax=Actinophytocola algeriensis TaxID=1768010 RepID=A0A7W7VIG2_9PSEU|nr:type I polyketide synthase [Actinophytocola algeriensis]MBB4911532.1 acyl transferase domain-containing protein/acyl carrier protein [Actinophytocola algeriensis]MBE1473480.1 acyl transferase domain-containing protein/acyl carrier protein [Actinophytocola algeriensis]
MRTGPRVGADRVRDAVAELLGVSRDSVAVDVPFRELGVDSAGVAGLATRLDVPVWAVWQCPTVAALGAFLDGDETTPPPTGAARRSGVEPVAIVGLGCRLPGGISSPDGLWSALLSEVDAVGPVPAGRWDADEWFDADPAAPGKTTTRRGGFLDDVAGFDADFFRISPAEAERMDPQQRIALEVAWSALEDARVVPGELAGTRTGVFFGTMWQEYHLATGADPATVGPQSAVGWDTSIVPSRIAYALGLQGPVLSVGSACSSSLGAVHLAAHSLRRGESDLVLAGGVNLMLHPHTTVAMTKFGGLNPAGQCRAFDAGAAGYVRGEGCAVVVLRRLSDALRDGDRIYAVLLGSAVNNDGASNGLTAPNPRAQVDVLRSAWHEAGVPAHRVSYVEAHGTGTPLGDVIEASALGEVFGPDRTEPLRVGSAKTNFGHLEPAAGVLGVLKTALALYHGELPASLHFDVPNPGIDFAALRLSVVAGRQAWPAGFRYAGVSGFGFGGTNVHVALAQPPYRRRVPVALAEDSAEALAARVADLDWSVPTLPTRTGPHRAVAWHDGGATTIRTGSGARRPVAFCFSGHGAQWAGMGRDLLAEPAFRAALTEVDAALAPLTGWSVVTELLAEQPRFDRTDVVQPALFAVQVALTRTLSAWGVVPDVVFGQSVGEVAAAVAAGALTLDQGARLITVWSRLVAERADGTGTVLVCAMSEVDAAPLVRGRLTTAAILADGWTCLSGPNDAIADVAGDLTDAGVRVHRVDIGYPAHSGGLAALVPELVERLGDLRPTPAAVPFVSTVTGAFVAGTGLDAKYWARNMCAPMLVADAVRALPTGCRIVEIGPHPVLRAQLAGMTDDDVLATCHREKAGRQTMEDLVADLWLDGATVDWPAVAGVTPAADAVPLPLSAATETGLRAQAAAVRAHLRAHPELSPADIGYSLATTRTAFDHRAVLLARDHTDAGLALTAVADGTTGPGVITGTSTTVDDAGPVFVFPGQGSQWTEMARDLLDAEPAFAARFAGCADALAEFVDWDPAAALADDDLLARADVVQPVLWAVMVSLAALWEAHGVRPAAVVGHSQGEIAAATVAGGLSIRDAALVVALRGKIIARELSGSGGMMSVPLSRDEIAWRLADWHAGLSVAAEIGPRATVVAGSAAALAVLVARCHAEGITVRRVAIDYPSHSAGVDPVADEVVTTLAPIRPGEGHVPYLSTVTGAPLATTALDAAYWYRNLRAPVELRAAVEQLIALGHRVFVEVSPHPVLTAGIADTGAALGVDVVTVGTLRRGAPGVARFRTSLAEAHVRGVAVDWRPAFPAAHTVDLPAYSFQHRRYWLGGNRPAATADTDFWDAVERGDLTGLGSALDLPADATLADLLPALAEWRRRTRPEPPHQEAEEAGPGFAERLAERPPGQRHDLVLDVVLRHIAAVLGYGPGEWPDADRAFRELGFDSVTGVQLRNRLGAELGIELPSTLVYDHPAPAALADHLLTGLGFGVRPAEQAPPERIEDASDDELFQFIDNITSRRAS